MHFRKRKKNLFNKTENKESYRYLKNSWVYTNYQDRAWKCNLRRPKFFLCFKKNRRGDLYCVDVMNQKKNKQFTRSTYTAIIPFMEK